MARFSSDAGNAYIGDQHGWKPSETCCLKETKGKQKSFFSYSFFHFFNIFFLYMYVFPFLFSIALFLIFFTGFLHPHRSFNNSHFTGQKKYKNNMAFTFYLLNSFHFYVVNCIVIYCLSCFWSILTPLPDTLTVCMLQITLCAH